MVDYMRLSLRILATAFAIGILPAVPATAAEDHPSVPPGTFALRDVSITLRRTSCFGTCPVYSVEIRGDGNGTFQGGPFSATEGKKEFVVELKTVLELLNSLIAMDFSDLKSVYTERHLAMQEKDGLVHMEVLTVTDVPDALLTLTIGGYTKTVEFNREYGPQALNEVADRIDTVTDSKKWTQPPPSQGR